MNKTIKKLSQSSFFPSLVSIAIGLLVGFVFLLIVTLFTPEGSYPIDAMYTIFTGGMRYMGLEALGTIFRFTGPVLLTGLSVGFAFRTGLFNIGASGQFIIGSFAAIFVALHFTFIPVEIRWIFALCAALLGGALWGMISGLLKAYRNVNEVISSIMLNYIGMFTVSNLIQYVSDPEFPSKSLAPLTRIPTMGLEKIFGNSTVDIGIFIALLFAFIVYVILEKTTFGFELKACGFNRNAARYAGVNDKRGIVLSMTIAGALAGLAGGLVYMSTITKLLDKILAMPTEGFDGITVALLSLSNPIGSIFSAIFISFIKNAGGSLTLSGFNEDIIKIMTAVIIYMSAFSIIFKERINKYFTKKVVK